MKKGMLKSLIEKSEKTYYTKIQPFMCATIGGASGLMLTQMSCDVGIKTGNVESIMVVVFKALALIPAGYGVIHVATGIISLVSNASEDDGQTKKAAEKKIGGGLAAIFGGVLVLASAKALGGYVAGIFTS